MAGVIGAAGRPHAAELATERPGQLFALVHDVASGHARRQLELDGVATGRARHTWCADPDLVVNAARGGEGHPGYADAAERVHDHAGGRSAGGGVRSGLGHLNEALVLLTTE